MNKYLYDCFSHWYHGGQVWFYSDPHFTDEEMKETRRNYITDEEQIKRINSKIGKKDTIIILGDVGNKEFLKKIRGYKVLILGNHDSGATTYEDYVDEVYEGCLMISDKILLSHEPVEFKYAFNIHGHDHSSLYNKDNMHYNVCAEAIDYTPVSLNSLVKTGYLKDVVSVHRDTIDEATARKKRKLARKS